MILGPNLCEMREGGGGGLMLEFMLGNLVKVAQDLKNHYS